MLLFQYIENDKFKKMKILGLTVFRQGWCDIDDKVFVEKKYLKGLFKIIENKNEKHFYLCGIPIGKYYRPVTHDMIARIVNSKMEKVESRLSRKVNDVYWDMYVLAQVPVLHKCFEQYKRCHEGRDIVIVATGPSAEYYKDLIPNAIHIGVNAAIRYDWINFKYVFANDGFLSNPDLNVEINNYKKDTCQKFYGMHSPRILGIIQKNGINVDRIAQTHLYDANAHRYLLQDARTRKWAINIECEPFGDIGSTAFSALQFACYTHPKRIYLVGCDASCSFSATGVDKQDYTRLINMWHDFANFVKSIYPDTEVISINPVGLKGLFNDIFTDNYQEETLLEDL